MGATGVTRRVRDTDRDWEKIAKECPYWGVLSADEFKGSNLSEPARRKFFASGEAYVSNLLGFVERHFGLVPLEKLLDFGCGVGRLVIPFAAHARKVVGVDAAPTMLERCHDNIQMLRINNVSLILGDDDLTNVTGPFDFINSTIVLQHIPPTRGLHLLEKLLTLLSPGGIFAVQMTYGRARRFLEHERPRARFYRRSGSALIDLLESEHQPAEGTITMYDYDLNEIMALFSQHAGSPLMVLPTCDDDHLGAQFIGRRALST
jgi:SAM-dependent methyltransferase